MQRWIEAIQSLPKVYKLALLAAVSVLLILSLQTKSVQTEILTQEEIRMGQIIEKIEGVKEASVMISYDAEECKRGIVVAVSGAEDIYTMLEIQRAVKTLTGLELDQIEIVNSGS